ncbi:bifunctional hydroxymethylpyrimidine kinase/phosphomethylpyrimidine kinase, partial [Staphylococcus epidermidis]|uniref:bifunctional hydroxymethylpyrimidine kinase/phosphomethylpyrimidine kinase n=1 Tax=Staphylococcus epidermidis TaxID=1282 RepID=UPI0028CB3C6E
MTTILPQNTLPLQHIHNLQSSSLNQQLHTLFHHQLPQPIKTGIIPTKKTIHFIQTYLNQHSNIPYLIHPLIL